MDMINVVIDRSTWLRGEGDDVSYLLRESDGKMCCLGFACLASGLTANDIEGHKSPYGLGANYMRSICLEDDLNPVAVAMLVNDDMLLPDDEREAAIVSEGAKIGLNFTFIDGESK